MKSTFLATLCVIFCQKMFSQISDSSVYGSLVVKKIHSVYLTSHGTLRNRSYQVNGREVSQQVYERYEREDSVWYTRCPFILRRYNEREVIVSEMVSCSDCGVGYYKEFYPSKRLKVKGQYKENPTGNWKDISERGFCSEPTGKWFYYEERDTNYHIKYTEDWNDGKPIGTWLYYNYDPKRKSNDIVRIEKWNNGEFVEQKPESREVEIWSVRLLLGEAIVDSQVLNIADIRNLNIVPKYKNKSRSTSLTVELNAWVNSGTTDLSKNYIVKNPDEININDLIAEPDFKKITELATKGSLHLSIGLFDNGKHLRTFYPKIIR